jgi:hypothetical protein
MVWRFGQPALGVEEADFGAPTHNIRCGGGTVEGHGAMDAGGWPTTGQVSWSSRRPGICSS